MKIVNENSISNAASNLNEAQGADTLVKSLLQPDFRLSSIRIYFGQTNEYLRTFEDSKHDAEIIELLKVALQRYSALKRQEAKEDLEFALEVGKFAPEIAFPGLEEGEQKID